MKPSLISEEKSQQWVVSFVPPSFPLSKSDAKRIRQMPYFQLIVTKQYSDHCGHSKETLTTISRAVLTYPMFHLRGH